MKYCVNGETPYFATLTEARKHALEVEPDGRNKGGFTLLSSICDGSMNVLGLVLVDEWRRFWYFDAKTDITSPMNEDGSMYKGDGFCRCHESQAAYFLQFQKEIEPFPTFESLVKAFDKIAKAKCFEPWGLVLITDANKDVVGQIFLDDKGKILVNMDGLVRTVSKNGALGNIRTDIYVDPEARTIYKGREAKLRGRIAAMNRVLNYNESSKTAEGKA